MILKSESGMTLIEVLASVVIIGIVFVTFFYFFVQDHLHTSINGEKLTATQLAQGELSKVLHSDINDQSLYGQCDPNIPDGTDNIIACYDTSNKLNNHAYHTYVYIQKQDSVDSLGLYFVVAKTYYHGNSFVELYNYTSKSQ